MELSKNSIFKSLQQNSKTKLCREIFKYENEGKIS